MIIDHRGETPVYQQIADILRARVVSGEYPPGRAIPSEVSLMSEFGVAQLTVRKAIRVLASEGLVRTVRARGSYVTSRAAEVSG